MYPFQLDRITRAALLHWELFSGRCEFLLEEAHPSDVATGPITARDEDELGNASLLHCISPVLCRFSAAGSDDLTMRSVDRRLKSAKARNRVGR
jgi:hypothetical protein